MSNSTVAAATRAGRPAPAKRRVDPPSRNPRGVEFGGLINPNPERKYVRANKVGHYGLEFYEWLGYEVEVLAENGVRLAGVHGTKLKTSQLGEPITYMDTVLMSCSLERWDEIQRIGPNGDKGQELADIMEARILDKHRADAMEDPSRGIFKSAPSVRGVRITKKVSDLTTEHGDIEAYGDDA